MLLKFRNSQDKEKDHSKKTVEYIHISKIRPNPYQPRKEFAEKPLLELSQSIKEYGLIQPITVRKMADGFYELIAGERRLRACKMAGMEVIPALVKESQEEDLAVLAMVENLQRENLHYLEEAMGFFSLITDHGFTQEELARKIGKSQSTIANKLRLLKLPNEVKELLRNSQLTERHSRALLRLSDKSQQLRVIHEIIEKGLSVKATEELIDSILTKKQKDEVKKNTNKKFVKAFKDFRIVLNTVKAAVDTMKDSGLPAEYRQVDKGDSIEITITIPKG